MGSMKRFYLLGFCGALLICAVVFLYFHQNKVAGSKHCYCDAVKRFKGYSPLSYAIVETGIIASITRRPDLQFHHVEDLSSPLFTYSALREDSSVRIIAIKKLRADIKDLYCVFSSSNSKMLYNFSIKASVENIPEHHESMYTAAYITCQIDRAHVYPIYVGLISEKNLEQKPKYFILIEDVRQHEAWSFSAIPRKGREVEFTVCTPPMFFKFKKAAQLVEMLEMSRLLGAERVVLYNNSIAPNVDAVLKMYIREYEQGRDALEVKVYPWQLPTINEIGIRKEIVKEEDIHYFGQMAAIDHCLHRYRQFSRYIIFSDLDEVITPVNYNNWSELISDQEKKSAPKGALANILKWGKKGIAGYLFQSTIFNRDRPSPALGFEKEALRFGSSVLGSTSRDAYFFPPNIRSKLILNPRKVDIMGIHFIWKGSGSTHYVPIGDGFLAHYRLPLFKCKSQVKDTTVVDKFGTRLATRLSQVWAKLPSVELGWEPVKEVATKVC